MAFFMGSKAKAVELAWHDFMPEKKTKKANAWQTDSFVARLGKALQTEKPLRQGHGKPIAYHRERQCITHGMPRPRVAKASITACQNKGWPRHGKPIACHQARNALLTACQDQGWPRHDSRHAKTRCGEGMASQLLVSLGKAMHFSRHANTKGGQGMTHSKPKQGVAKAWQANCLSPGKAMHCSRHAKTKGSQLLVSPGKAMHWSRHAKTKGGQGMTHDMPKQGVDKAWQADCLSPGNAMRCSWHAKTRSGQGMASRLLDTGQGNALLTPCQNKGWPRHGKPIA
ncbi:hypothetical protein RHGRI_011011 [Rhododendron griersonianum]|uniref:Uncharacterized protein n=1 Tax=Rhododendron griersonianum TaxID=479676 RepID=A0AAV6KKG6_9ERIC|nr:hypothetical protein RHGRI_011011 [Rhododendron griersonianum]